MYSSVSLSLAYHNGDPGCLPAYSKLRVLSKSRRLRLYPKSVTVENYTLSGQGRRHRTVGNSEITDEVRRVCDSIFDELDSPYMDKDEMESWHDKVGGSEVGAANCLLLTLLPNVKSVFVWENDHFYSEMANIIHKISKTNEKASRQIWETLSLVKLQEVNIYSLGSSGRDTGKSGVMEAFMTLPSLRTVRGRHLGPGYTFDRWIYPDHCSNVTELHFRGCTLPVRHLARLFRYLKTLRIFSYDHSRIAEDPAEKYGPRELINTLCSFAGKTLTFLNYTSDARDKLRDHRKPSTATLHNFEALKTLRISRVILIAKRPPQRLVSELPSSLEELELVDPISAVEAEQMIEALLAMKQERFPNLRLIVFEGAIPFIADRIAAYERTGLVLDWRDIGADKIQKTGQDWLGGIKCERG